MSDQAAWDKFEADLAEEFGIERVPGSGNQWHSKLDLVGNGVRWSLKYTKSGNFPIKFADLYEAINVGLRSGCIPMWAVRIEQFPDDFIIMRKRDFKSMLEEEFTPINQVRTKTDERRARARTPILQRESRGSE